MAAHSTHTSAASRLLLLTALVLLGAAARCQAQRYCPRQKLVVVRPEDLGVTHITLYGEMHNNVSNSKEFVNFHAYVRMAHNSSSNRVRLYGIGWVEGPATFPSYAPNHVPYLSKLPEMLLQPFSSTYKEVDRKVPVQVTQGTTHITGQWGFRLEAEFDNDDRFYEWRLEGWGRTFALHASNRATPGAICPWYKFDVPHSKCRGSGALGRQTRPRMARGGGAAGSNSGGAAAGRGLLQDPAAAAPVVGGGAAAVEPARVPLVAVVCFGRRPHDSLASNVYAAQQLIRHAEYHLEQIGMQRMLVYCSMGLLYDPEFRHYVERFLPPSLVPYVTLVAWNGVSKTFDYYYDQHLKYYHAVVSLWDYGNVLAALIDPDEYIAFPAPHVSLHEALARCNATGLDSVRLVNVLHVCGAACLDKYAALPAPGGQVDMDLWFSVAHADARYEAQNSTARGSAAAAAAARGRQQQADSQGGMVWAQQCRWWKQDPLAFYDRVWNDKWQLEQREVKESDLNTPRAWELHLGKHMIRPERARAFMHHHAEMMPGSRQELLDPRRCPHVAHLSHLNEYRPSRFAGDVKYFRDPERKAEKWWLITLSPSP